MNHSQVAHVWANQSKPKGKSSNIFFDGPTIYSYGRHFPIATHVTNKQGEKAIIFTRETYSKSTGSHKSLVMNALRGLGIPVFYGATQSGGYLRDYDFGTDKASLRASCKQYIEDAKEAVLKAKRSKIRGRSWIIRSDDLLAEALKMTAFFKLGVRVPSSLLTEDERNEILFKNEEYEALSDERRTKARIARDIREAKQREERMVADAAKFESWKRGEGYGCPWSYSTDGNGSAYLRIKGNEVQTSRGASVPIADAKRAFRFVKLCKEQSRPFKANGERVLIGDFGVRTVDEAGNLQIGCHYITWERIEECAKAGGFFDESPSDEAVTHGLAAAV